MSWLSADTAPTDGSTIVAAFKPHQTGDTDRLLVVAALYTGNSEHPWLMLDSESRGYLNRASARSLFGWHPLDQGEAK